jgi:hypothetical protein
MKTLVRFAVAGALLVGAQAAFAQTAPANASDLWLFVSDPAAGVTFAEDTGYSLSALLPTSGDTAGTILGTNSASNAGSIDLAESSALATFISTYGASNLEWGVLGTLQAGAQPNKAGNNVAVGSAAPTAGNLSSISQLVVAPNLEQTTAAFQSDVGALVSNYTVGGKNYTWNAAGSAVNLWGSTSGTDNGGSTDFYGAGIQQAGNGLGAVVSLYGITGNGTTGQTNSYDLTDALTLTAGGVLEASPVPIPAAVWLFGSGLLGLIGVGRRRAA